MLVAGCSAYPPQYVWRVLSLRDSDVDDMHVFPRRDIAAAPGAADIPLAPDPERVRQAFAKALPGQSLEPWLEARGTLAFVVLQRGRVIYEGYFGGQQRDAPVTSFSVAKSVLGTLVDLAAEQGRIGSLDDAVTLYVPELAARDPRFERVTLRHLLDMDSGLRYREFPFVNGDDARTYYFPDLRRLAIEQTSVERPPASGWQYNNYHPLLLGLVLERTTGMPVSKWLEVALWQPAGMAGGASWSLDSEASGFEKLESGLNARALDFARFGQLFLDDGVALDGRRVVAAVDVRAATAPDGARPLDAMRPGLYYKHFWWGQRLPAGGYAFSARGNHGQFVFVSPANGTVIARFGREYGVPPGEWARLAEAMADTLGGAPPAAAR